jgi:DegV family protein with EDD domain
LGADIAVEFNVRVVPLSVIIGGEVFRDGVDVNQNDLFAMMEKFGELPKTAAPAVGEFFKAFNQPGEVIYNGISSKLSATIQNAILAAGAFPAGKVRVIDSFNISTGVGLLVLQAAHLRDLGLSSEQIERELLDSIQRCAHSLSSIRWNIYTKVDGVRPFRQLPEVSLKSIQLSKSVRMERWV